MFFNQTNTIIILSILVYIIYLMLPAPIILYKNKKILKKLSCGCCINI